MASVFVMLKKMKRSCLPGLPEYFISLLLRGGQVLAWLRQTAQFALVQETGQRINNMPPVKLLVFLASQGLTTARDEVNEISGLQAVRQDVAAENRR